MTFWRPIWILLALRFAVARNAFRNNPTAQLGAAIMTGVLALSASGMGSALAREWRHSTSAAASASLEGVLLVIAAVIAIASTLPGMLSMMGPIPPENVLKPFAVTRLQRMIAELLACFLDLPSLLVFLTVAPLGEQLMYESHRFAAATLIACTALLALLTGIAVRTAAHQVSRFVRRFHRVVEASMTTAALFVLVSIALPPAFAALTNPQVAGLNHPRLQTEVGAVRSLSPAHLAAESVVSASSGVNRHSTSLLVLLAAQMAGLFGIAARLNGRDTMALGPKPGLTRCNRIRTDAGSLRRSRLAALVLTDFKLLLREPLRFAVLRRPAAMIMVGFFSLLAPDLGRNPVYSAKEILCLTATVYPFLWQLQLLCNRFGGDAGRGALLFGFSTDRRLLVFGRNLSLMALLLLVNGGALSALAAVVGSRDAIMPILWRLPVILMLATSVGNLVSVLQPFPIPRTNGKESEPPNSLMAMYITIIVGIFLLMECMMPASGQAAIGVAPSVVIVVGIYVVSVLGGARMLERKERAIIGKLDGGGL